MNEKHNPADMVIKALRRARQLGQDYWQYSDSEYRSDWEKADATLDAFDQLVADTKAALTSNSGAQPAPSVPDGWKLVPIEPTKEMLKSGQAEWLDCAGADPSWDVYQAMVKAAPNERSESPETKS